MELISEIVAGEGTAAEYDAEHERGSRIWQAYDRQ